MQKAWSSSADEVLKNIDTRIEGFSTKEAAQRLSSHGKNIISKKRDFAIIRILFEQLNSSLIYILVAAMIISFWVHSAIDGYVILAIIFLNTGIGFFQQYRAEHLIAHLRSFMVPKVTVRRDGRLVVIDSSDLVVGDIVMLHAGETVSADLRLISTDGLHVNEAVLTGESSSTAKDADIVLSDDVALADRVNMVFSGTSVAAGSGEAVVVATGDSTAFGTLAVSLQHIQTSKTPMQRRIELLSRKLTLLILGLVILIFLISLYHGNDFVSTLLVAITLAVGAIPEGLPAVMAIAFSISSALLAKRNVVVRRLPAVESLGSVSVICTDKTGTLTAEEMHVEQIYCDETLYTQSDGEILSGKRSASVSAMKSLRSLFSLSVLASDARFEQNGSSYEFLGDSTEVGLLRNALAFDVNRKVLTEAHPRLHTLAFDGERKMMSILRKNSSGSRLYSKGASSAVLPICTHELVNGRVRRVTASRRKRLLEISSSMEAKGLRTLAFAYKDISSVRPTAAGEEQLTFVGFIGMIDPPRDGVADSVARALHAGISVKMITGDSLLTAQAISAKIGITGVALDSVELDAMSDSELYRRINEIAIFARATPQQKLRILRTLQKKGHTVAMTGDGVNDVLALKSADVGISMGVRGTDVARDVSDIVLLDDNFSSIVSGVEYGRVTYDNIKKFTKYMLSVNFSTIALVSLTTLFGGPLPILPLQILWKNIITDSFPAISLIFEEGENVMNTSPRSKDTLLSGTSRFLATGALLNFAAAGFIYLYSLYAGYTQQVMQTMVMMTGIFFELLFVYSARSERKITEIGLFSNRFLNWSFGIAVLLTLGLAFTPLGSFFYVSALSVSQWSIILGAACSGVLLYEVQKYLR